VRKNNQATIQRDDPGACDSLGGGEIRGASNQGGRGLNRGLFAREGGFSFNTHPKRKNKRRGPLFSSVRDHMTARMEPGSGGGQTEKKWVSGKKGSDMRGK